MRALTLQMAACIHMLVIHNSSFYFIFHFGHQRPRASICDFLKTLSQRMQESIEPKAQITYMGSISNASSGPRPKIFYIRTVIFNVVWLAYKTDISEEVRSRRSYVISRLFVVPRPPTQEFRITHSVAFMLDAIIQICTRSQIALLWTHFGHQSTSICDFMIFFLSENAGKHRSKGTAKYLHHL